MLSVEIRDRMLSYDADVDDCVLE